MRWKILLRLNLRCRFRGSAKWVIVLGLEIRGAGCAQAAAYATESQAGSLCYGYILTFGLIMLTQLMRLAVVGWIICGGMCLAQEPSDPPARWWKGNLHTHTLWSDGNDFPEMVAAWYVEHGYNFLALSDHNVLSRGMRWMPLDKIIARNDEKVLDRYRQKFGPSWVELKGAVKMLTVQYDSSRSTSFAAWSSRPVSSSCSKGKRSATKRKASQCI